MYCKDFIGVGMIDVFWILNKGFKLGCYKFMIEDGEDDIDDDDDIFEGDEDEEVEGDVRKVEES